LRRAAPRPAASSATRLQPPLSSSSAIPHAAQWFPALDLISRQRHWRLTATGAKVAAIADTPYMGQSVPEYLGRPENQKHATNCRRSLRSALRGPLQRQVFLSYAPSGPAKIIDPINWFCTDACPAVVGNTLVYRDSNHMTTSYSTAIAPLLSAALG
jgi:hypothetical protein